jgi:spermidine dehydrogenase
VVRDLPEAHATALSQFQHSALLVANVALTNWRFLHKLGITACRYAGEFGFSCNIRRPMIVGDYRPPLDPDAPTVLTFYAPFFYPGRPAKEQGTRGRLELVTTSFADYERQIRRQMTSLFEGAGFDPRKDIAGIVLNRWGHAYVNPQPGFFFGKEGAPAFREVLRQRHGRIAFGHSELEGHQNWPGAVRNGARAARQVLDAA